MAVSDSEAENKQASISGMSLSAISLVLRVFSRFSIHSVKRSLISLLQQSQARPSRMMRSTRSRIWRVAVAIPRPNSALSSKSELAQAGPKPLR